MDMKVTKNFGSELVPLRQLDADVPHKMLGVLTEPADLNISQIGELKRKCACWNKKMIASSLTNRQKWMSYSFALRPSLEYCLPVLMLDETIFQDLLKPAFLSMKHALSLSSTSPTSVLFFPKSFGGFGAMNMWVRHLTMAS